VRCNPPCPTNSLNRARRRKLAGEIQFSHAERCLRSLSKRIPAIATKALAEDTIFIGKSDRLLGVAGRERVLGIRYPPSAGKRWKLVTSISEIHGCSGRAVGGYGRFDRSSMPVSAMAEYGENSYPPGTSGRRAPCRLGQVQRPLRH